VYTTPVTGVTNRLRPELVRRFPASLSSDAYSRFESVGVSSDPSRRLVEACTETVWATAIPEAAARLVELYRRQTLPGVGADEGVLRGPARVRVLKVTYRACPVVTCEPCRGCGSVWRRVCACFLRAVAEACRSFMRCQCSLPRSSLQRHPVTAVRACVDSSSGA
jgi:hypothetical protein